jgi:drug/metabolite transporter (DMT)-like permease
VFTIFAWGANYPLMKLAISDIPPLMFTACRLWGAVVVLGAVAFASGRAPLLPFPEERVDLAVVGLLQIGAMLGLTIIGLNRVPAGRTALLVYTMPLWAVPLGRLILGEKIHRRKLIGVVVGMVGIMYFFNPLVIDWNRKGTVVGCGLILSGSIAWAWGACLYRRKRWRSSVITQTSWQLLIASIPIAVLGFATENTSAIDPSLQLVAILVYNWVIATALAMWCWNRVLAVMIVSTAGQFLLFTPLVGFLLSVMFLGETAPKALLVSAFLILIGLWITVRSEGSSTSATR